MNPNRENEKKVMRQEIMNVIRANGVPITGDLWFSLIFRTHSELKKICNELHIVTKGI